MVTSASFALKVKLDELQRLQTLVPLDWQQRITLLKTLEVNPVLIEGKAVNKYGKFKIFIDLVRWEQLTLDQRDLLFWHQLARIQNNTLPNKGWELHLLAIGLGSALVEVGVQNLVLLSAALLLASMSGFQLYQRNRGESSLREATAADREAISLATQFGYTLPQAYKSLSKALKTLIIQTPQKYLQKSYKARRQVLKITAIQARATRRTSID
ncbi:MAG: DUF3318 domain-containing protein [Chamaesiphon sp.]